MFNRSNNGDNNPKPAKWSRAQDGEFRFHLTDEWRQTEEFDALNALLFRAFNFYPHDFKGLVVLDIGAGSRLRSRFFQGAQIIAVEPLADKFIEEIEWCDLKDAHRLYSQPAEELIEELKGKIDFAMCINVLDHTYDPVQTLTNARSYLKPNGQLLLSVDLHWKGDRLHPVHFSRRKIDAMVKKAGFGIMRVYFGLPNKPGYGDGQAYSLLLAAADNPDDIKPAVITVLGEMTRYSRLLSGASALFGPLKRIRNIFRKP